MGDSFFRLKWSYSGGFELLIEELLNIDNKKILFSGVREIDGIFLKLNISKGIHTETNVK